MKIFSVLLVILASGFLVACRGESGEPEIVETPPAELNNHDDQFIAPESDVAANHFLQDFWLTWGSSNDYVSLIAVTTGATVGYFAVDEQETIWQVFNFENGYFGLLVGDRGTAEEIAEGVFISTNHNQDEQLRYLVLNQALQVIADLPITDEGTYGLAYIGSWLGSYVYFTGTELLVYYPFTAIQAIWYDSVQGIRRFNATTGVTQNLVAITEPGLDLNQIVRVNAETIAFRGHRLNLYGQLEYGFINLTTGTMTLFSEPDFNANHDGLITRGEHVLIAEEFAPPTMGVAGGLSVLRGEVLAFNVVTGVNRVISLDGLASFWATLSLDGRYVVTVDEQLAYLRKYDVATGQLVNQVAVNLVGERIILLHPLSATEFLVQTTGNDGINPFELIEIGG